MMRKIVVTVNGAKVGNKLPSKECSTLGADFLGNVQKKKDFLYAGQKFQCHHSTYNNTSIYTYIHAHG